MLSSFVSREALKSPRAWPSVAARVKSDARTRVNWRTYPALETEEFFRVLWGLALDGKTDRRGAPNLLQMAVIAREYRDEFRLAQPPYAVQGMIFAPLALVGRPLGYRERHPQRK